MKLKNRFKLDDAVYLITLLSVLILLYSRLIDKIGLIVTALAVFLYPQRFFVIAIYQLFREHRTKKLVYNLLGLILIFSALSLLLTISVKTNSFLILTLTFCSFYVLKAIFFYRVYDRDLKDRKYRKTVTGAVFRVSTPYYFLVFFLVAVILQPVSPLDPSGFTFLMLVMVISIFFNGFCNCDDIDHELKSIWPKGIPTCC